MAPEKLETLGTDQRHDEVDAECQRDGKADKGFDHLCLTTG